LSALFNWVKAGLLRDPEALFKMFSEMPTPTKGVALVIEGFVLPTQLRVLEWDDDTLATPKE